MRVTAAFTDAAGTAIDPGTVTLTYRTPNGATATGTVVKDSAGNYHADIDTTAVSGLWRYRWVGTGTGQAAGEGQFQVDGVV